MCTSCQHKDKRSGSLGFLKQCDPTPKKQFGTKECHGKYGQVTVARLKLSQKENIRVDYLLCSQAK